MKKKTWNFMRFVSGFLVLMLYLTLMPTIQVNASDTSVDLVGDSSEATSGRVKYGVSYCQTGYLCYLLTADGNSVAGTSAYAFKCPGFATITAGGSPVFRATSRKGGYVATSWRGVAPWGCSPFNSDKTTNAETIRNWMKEPAGLVSKGQQFVKDIWGETCERKWAEGEYILVIETIMHFRYSFDYTYDKSYSESDWAELVRERFGRGMPESVAMSAGRQYYRMAQEGTIYRAPFCNPIIGTVRDCLDYYSVVKNVASSSNAFITIKDSNLFSTYLNNVVCYAERIGSGSAGERAGFLPWTGTAGTRLSNAEVRRYGVGMLVISALDDDIAPPTDTGGDDTTTSDYDGTVYTLTATGGSSSSGTGSSATTYFGNGSGSCLSGSLYAENCASGTDAYNLADSMKRGMSYDGDVPPVVFSGTSYDLSVDSSLGIIAGMLTVDPSTFPYVDISSTDASGYSSYLSAITSGIEPSIDRCYDGRVSGTYYDGTMDCSPVIGGAK